MPFLIVLPQLFKPLLTLRLFAIAIHQCVSTVQYDSIGPCIIICRIQRSVYGVFAAAKVKSEAPLIAERGMKLLATPDPEGSAL